MKANLILTAVVVFFFFNVGVTNAQSTSEKLDNYLEFMVECDGVQDIINGPVPQHKVNHTNKTGDSDWVNSQFIGKDLVSMATGELFRVNLIVTVETVVPGTIFQITKHYNLVGSEGSHMLYSVVIIYDWTGGYFKATVLKEKGECL